MPETLQLQALMNRLGPRAAALLSSLEDALDRGGEAAVISLLSLASSGSHGEAPGGGAPRAEAERYRELAWLGRGGMGEVMRVSDGWMGRPVVRKVMLAGRDPARFLREARLTARLQHPGVPPVFEIGTLPDGRPYYTMAEVRGRTLATAIAEVHATSGGGRWGDTAQGMSLRRLIDAFHRVAEVVAYAHGQGVLHRDIKPQNVMLGDFGQVFLLDWGLARDLRSGGEPAAEVDDPGAAGTRWGAVLGTPAYMAPEQAAGEGARVGPPADVYALGAVLYEILCGASPYPSNQVADVLVGPPPPVQLQAGALPLPDELTRLVEACLARRPEARPLSAAEVAAEVGAWLDGARRRDQALEAVRQADALVHEITRLRARADTLAAEAGEALREIPTWAAEEIKAPHWAREDEAEGLRQDAEVLEIRRLQGLRSALNHVSDLPEAHERLAAHYQGQHTAAEARRDPSAASRAELLLREHDRPGRFATYLKGTGAVTLLTDPPGAEVTLYRYETYNRRLVERLVGPLGRTPLREVPLERGSYLLILRKEGHQDVRYPVSIGRGEHWHGVPPDETEPMPIPLPREGELGPDDCYVPAGWFWAGGDYLTPDPVQLWRPWSDGLIVRRFPVSNNEFLMFLNSLVAMGLVGDADRWVPRERAGSTNQHGAILYHKDEYGRFFLVPTRNQITQPPTYNFGLFSIAI